MEKTPMLKIGDLVNWRGAWGSESAKKARVVSMEEVSPGEKYGYEINEMEWELVRQNRCVVGLDNGHWAYGNQLEKRR
jgi:hypothetical protein